MPTIHALAEVDSSAQLAENVIVGPFCVIEAGVVIGAGTRIDSHVTVRSGTTIGCGNKIGEGSVLGGDPQDRKYDGAQTFLKIGNENTIREYVTMHRASGEGNTTIVGDDNYIMAQCHLGHNVTVHNHVTIANATGVSGYCTIEDYANIGGMTGVHQFCRIGKAAMIGGFTKISRDAPPFLVTDGLEQNVLDINAIGLRRLGITPERRLALHKACKLLFKSRLGLSHAMETVRREVAMTDEVLYLLEFEERRFRGKNGRGDQP